MASRIKDLDSYGRREILVPKEPSTPASRIASVIADSETSMNSDLKTVDPPLLFRKFSMATPDMSSGNMCLMEEKMNERDNDKVKHNPENDNTLLVELNSEAPTAKIDSMTLPENGKTFIGSLATELPNSVPIVAAPVQISTHDSAGEPLNLPVLINADCAEAVGRAEFLESRGPNFLTAGQGLLPAGSSQFPNLISSDRDIISNNNPTPVVIPLPDDLPDFMHEYYKIGATLMGMEATKKFHSETIACLGFGKKSDYTIPNIAPTTAKLEEILGHTRKSARLQDNLSKKNKKFSPSDDDSDSSSSLVF